MILLLDAGNSRLKWWLCNGQQRPEKGVAWLKELDTLPKLWTDLARPQRILGCNVANPLVAAHIEQTCEQLWQCPPQWLEVSAQACGVRNHYQLRELGPDRWASAIAARHLHRGNTLAVNAGSAITIDAISAGGDYLGGTILPGLQGMHAALASNTARLPNATGQVTGFPRQTVDAISSGLIDAVVGAIERMAQRLENWQPQPPLVLLSGGDAFRIEPHLHLPHQLVDNLVLEGLRVISL